MKYYPLIRGRQYDLLALNATLAADLSMNVVPIIEPVKDIAALPRVIAAFAKAQHPLFVIQNPQVGQYGLLAHPRYPVPAALPVPVQFARYFDGGSDTAPLVITQTSAQVRLLAPNQLALVPDAARVRALRHGPAIYLADHYPTRGYTDEYHTLQDELYQYPLRFQPGAGLADYPLATATYDEHGYPQRAIAVHLLHIQRGALYVQHLVSVNNDDFANPGAKFLEALQPLPQWLAMYPDAATPATDELLRLRATQHFPGLGTVRKLELMHWLTVMDRWLSE
jgi:hypothetical protein